MDEEAPPPAQDDSIYLVPDQDYYELLLAQETVLRWKAELRACEAAQALVQSELDNALSLVDMQNDTIVRRATEWGKYEITGDFVLSRTQREIARKRKE